MDKNTKIVIKSISDAVRDTMIGALLTEAAKVLPAGVVSTFLRGTGAYYLNTPVTIAGILLTPSVLADDVKVAKQEANNLRKDSEDGIVHLRINKTEVTLVRDQQQKQWVLQSVEYNSSGKDANLYRDQDVVHACRNLAHTLKTPVQYTLSNGKSYTLTISDKGQIIQEPIVPSVTVHYPDGTTTAQMGDLTITMSPVTVHKDKKTTSSVHHDTRSGEQLAQDLAIVSGVPIQVTLKDGSTFTGYPADPVSISPERVAKLAQELAAATGTAVELKRADGRVELCFPPDTVAMSDTSIRELAVKLACATGISISVTLSDNSTYTALPEKSIAMSPEAVSALAAQLATATGHAIDIEGLDGKVVPIFPAEQIRHSDTVIEQMAVNLAQLTGHPIEITLSTGKTVLVFPPETIHLSDRGKQDLLDALGKVTGHPVSALTDEGKQITLPKGTAGLELLNKLAEENIANPQPDAADTKSTSASADEPVGLWSFLMGAVAAAQADDPGSSQVGLSNDNAGDQLTQMAAGLNDQPEPPAENGALPTSDEPSLGGTSTGAAVSVAPNGTDTDEPDYPLADDEPDSLASTNQIELLGHALDDQEAEGNQPDQPPPAINSGTGSGAGVGSIPAPADDHDGDEHPPLFPDNPG